MSEVGHKWLKSVLSSNLVNTVMNTMDQRKIMTERYENKEFVRYVINVAIEELTAEEWSVLKLRYYSDMTQHEVADMLDKHQKWVSRREDTRLNKLRKSVL